MCAIFLINRLARASGQVLMSVSTHEENGYLLRTDRNESLRNITRCPWRIWQINSCSWKKTSDLLKTNKMKKTDRK